MSELPFRMLCRKYGAEICYTPMFHSKNFSESKLYRARNFTTCPEDRPLVVQVRTVKFQIVAINPFLQFCANNPDYLLKAALYVQDYADAVDSKFSILNSNQLNSLQSTSVVHRVLQSGDTMDPSCWRTGL